MENKYPDSPRDIEINTLCTNSRFGTDANFMNAVAPLQAMVKDIVELENLDYRGKLTRSEIKQIDNVRNTVIGYINQIKNFSVALPNPVEQRDKIVSQIDSYYQNSFAGAIRPALVYLKSQIRETAKDERQLRELVTKTESINKDIEDRLEKIKEKEQELEKDKKSLATGQGIFSSQYLSKQFANEAENAKQKAFNWQKWVLGLSITLILVLSILFAGYFLVRKVQDDSILKIEYGVFSITFVASIFFYLRIVLRNYNIEKHIESSNRHRANVAATIENLLAVADRDEALKEALLKEGSIAMFNPGSTGYLDREQMEVSTPIKEVVTTLIKGGQN